MKVLLSWLREFAPFEGDPVELGEQMSDLGMAVESLDVLGGGLDGIVVARVLALRPHPNADKIQLVDVDTGDGEPLQICCGAFNMAVGDLVPLATLGTVMPGGMAIERRKMRGEWSNGMLCSGRELELGDDHSGILVLPPALADRLGAPFAEAMGIEADVLYDLEINPNRPDAMSVAGVARDLAARMGLPFTPLSPAVPEGGAAIAGRASVTIHDPELCGRFLVRILEGVQVGDSPEWLARRLTLLGMRPINSIVDISNYVMLELGQPNHTYDLDKVPGGELHVRWAREGETIRTLDDTVRTLRSTDGVIADRSDHAIGIAGVMGGASTEISASTRNVLLEMAWWAPMAIAISSAQLGLRSEASMRFERGADPEGLELAAQRFAELVAAGAPTSTLAAGTVVAEGDLPSREAIRVRTERVSALLGHPFTGEDVRRLLEPIGFVFDQAADGVDGEQLVRIPSFRFDTTTETDVIEEVARHHGYSRIGRRMPSGVHAGRLSERQRDRRTIRQVLVGLGLDEAMPMPFLAPGDLDRAGLGEIPPVTIANPLAAEESVLRTSLRAGLLKAIAYNESHRNEGAQLFEIGKVWSGHRIGPDGVPDEREQLCAVLAGVDAHDAVRTLRTLLSALAVPGIGIEQVAVPGLHPTRAGEVVATGGDGPPVRLGAVGEIDPSVLDDFGIAARVACLELDLDALLALPHGERPYAPISRYPSSDTDLAFEVADTVPAADVEATIRHSAGPRLVDLRLFDVYRGPGVAAAHRSLAYRLRFQAPDRTLTDEDVASARAAVIAAVEATHPARLRA